MLDKDNETLNRLASILSAEGIYARLETCAYDDLTLSDRYLVCAEKQACDEHGNIWPHGISFRLMAGSGIALLIMPSTATLRVGRFDRLAQLMQDLFSGEYIRKGAAPYVLPDSLMRAYAMHYCERIWLYPPGDCETCEEANKLGSNLEFTRDAFIGALDLLLDVVRPMENEMIEMRLGTAVGLCRCRLPRPWLSILLNDALRPTEDQYRLMVCLAEGLGCSIFDGDWETRIHLDDPYYLPNLGASRPESPRNYQAEGD